ncbi:GNAT family N-acetyltransferase [Tissierella pigra]|uniref:GNAT family N-acetyltransferase n=1 Tax=Tissierella pigra TaxID=2607614 RepID=UPI001C115ADD|nr:GNAT family N-acetyltransferase [Tissierella pigra]MBU5427584.1 GNAT family N-acetyltransferase [Tissierella pigra]
MLTVNFHDLNTIEDDKLKFAVIMAKHEGKWIFVRHKERLTWEIPGGHREKGEDIYLTASRELMEETGAKEFRIIPVCVYSVTRDETKSFGQLFYSDVESLDELPNSEIGEIRLFNTIPERLTYPLIQPYLFEKVEKFHRQLAMETIRPGNIRDRSNIEELIKVMIGDENPNEISKLVVDDFFTNSSYHVYVIEILNVVKGFGVIKFNPFEGGNGIAEFVWLGIDKDSKRAGLGSKLVQYLEQYSRENGIRKIYVKTSVTNKSAICFWIMQDYKFEARMLDFSLKSYDDYYLGKEL